MKEVKQNQTDTLTDKTEKKKWKRIKN